MNKADWETEGTMASVERAAIVRALVACDYHRGAAAEQLRIGRSTLYRMIKDYAIEMPAVRKPATRDARSRKAEDTLSAGPKIVFENGHYILVND